MISLKYRIPAYSQVYLKNRKKKRIKVYFGKIQSFYNSIFFKFWLSAYSRAGFKHQTEDVLCQALLASKIAYQRKAWRLNLWVVSRDFYRTQVYRCLGSVYRRFNISRVHNNFMFKIRQFNSPTNRSVINELVYNKKYFKKRLYKSFQKNLLVLKHLNWLQSCRLELLFNDLLERSFSQFIPSTFDLLLKHQLIKRAVVRITFDILGLVLKSKMFSKICDDWFRMNIIPVQIFYQLKFLILNSEFYALYEAQMFSVFIVTINAYIGYLFNFRVYAKMHWIGKVFWQLYSKNIGYKFYLKKRLPNSDRRTYLLWSTRSYLVDPVTCRLYSRRDYDVDCKDALLFCNASYLYKMRFYLPNIHMFKHQWYKYFQLAGWSRLGFILNCFVGDLWIVLKSLKAMCLKGRFQKFWWMLETLSTIDVKYVILTRYNKLTFLLIPWRLCLWLIFTIFFIKLVTYFRFYSDNIVPLRTATFFSLRFKPLRVWSFTKSPYGLSYIPEFKIFKNWIRIYKQFFELPVEYNSEYTSYAITGKNLFPAFRIFYHKIYWKIRLKQTFFIRCYQLLSTRQHNKQITRFKLITKPYILQRKHTCLFYTHYFDSVRIPLMRFFVLHHYPKESRNFTTGGTKFWKYDRFTQFRNIRLEFFRYMRDFSFSFIINELTRVAWSNYVIRTLKLRYKRIWAHPQPGFNEFHEIGSLEKYLVTAPAQKSRISLASSARNNINSIVSFNTLGLKSLTVRLNNSGYYRYRLYKRFNIRKQNLGLFSLSGLKHKIINPYDTLLKKGRRNLGLNN